MSVDAVAAAAYSTNTILYIVQTNVMVVGTPMRLAEKSTMTN